MIQQRHRIGSEAFTLVEALMASVLLTLVVSASLLPFTAGMQNDQISGRQTEAVCLAQDLMEEILAKPFYDPNAPNHKLINPGADNNENARETFDNIDDYHQFVETGGEVIPALSDEVAADVDGSLVRVATVTYVHLDGQDAEATPNVCRVIVSVYDGASELIRLSRLVYGDADGIPDGGEED